MIGDTQILDEAINKYIENGGDINKAILTLDEYLKTFGENINILFALSYVKAKLHRLTK